VKFVPRGGGTAARKFAAWANKVHSGSLGKYITPGRNVSVSTTTSTGVSISTVAQNFQTLALTESKPYGGSPLYATANWVTPDGDVVASPVEHLVYFTYSPGWYADNQKVVCINLLGRWEVMSPPAGDHFEGTLNADLTPGGTVGVDITSFGVGPGYLGTVSAINCYDLIGDTDDVCGIEWQPNRQQFVITAVKCPVATGGDDADGGSALDGTGSGDEDGGTPDTGSGSLDGGSP
jgi:hypothetical protein